MCLHIISWSRKGRGFESHSVHQHILFFFLKKSFVGFGHGIFSLYSCQWENKILPTFLLRITPFRVSFCVHDSWKASTELAGKSQEFLEITDPCISCPVSITNSISNIAPVVRNRVRGWLRSRVMQVLNLYYQYQVLAYNLKKQHSFVSVWRQIQRHSFPKRVLSLDIDKETEKRQT